MPKSYAVTTAPWHGIIYFYYSLLLIMIIIISNIKIMIMISVNPILSFCNFNVVIAFKYL